MFEFVRNHKKWMQLLLALIIAPMFIIGGVGLSQSGVGSEEVATVNDKKVTQVELDEAERQQIDTARANSGNSFDPKMFESPEAKQAILDGLIAQKSVDAEIRASHLTISDDMVKKAILDLGAFNKPDGTFDEQGYIAFLKSQNKSAVRFQDEIRADMTQKQFSNAIVATAFAPRTLAARVSDIIAQEREVQEMLFPIAQFVPQVQVTPAMIKAFYDKNASLFQIPETVKAEYVVFDASAVEKLVTVDDAEVAKFYEDNKKDKFKTPEVRKASHILITVKPGDAAQKAAAKAQAEALLAEVRAAPAKFADVAKAHSQDVVSKDLGGDLGQIDKNSVDPQLYEPILKLKQGEISNLVETSFGFHIVTVTSLVPESFKSLDEAKPLIAAELKKQKMSKKYSELAEKFNNTIDEQSASLKPVADLLGLKLDVADGLTRSPSPALGASPVNNAKFLKALFAADAIKNKRNIEAVEVAPSVLVAGRVIEHKPAALQPLAQVEAAIRERVIQEEAGKLAAKAGEAKIAAAKASGDTAGFGEVKAVSRSKPATIPKAAVEAVFKADTSKLPAFAGLNVPGAGYAVYRIGKVGQPAQPDLARRKSEEEQISYIQAQQEMASYVEALKVKAKAKIKRKQISVADAK
jgi:peptidyl-prolyl cis-trans isomerase D